MLNKSFADLTKPSFDLFSLRLPSRQRKAASETPFENVMAMAEQIQRQNPAALHDLIAALLRPLQSECLLAVAEYGMHSAPAALEGMSFFFDLRGTISIYDCHVEPMPLLQIDLAKDIVLPMPWHRHRYADALSYIGSGKKNGAWMVDSLNHYVEVWLPWRIAFVNGGNHSIAAGILAGEGKLNATSVIDLSPVFNLVRCTGNEYISCMTGNKLASAKDHRRAAVFEIGRMLIG